MSIDVPRMRKWKDSTGCSIGDHYVAYTFCSSFQVRYLPVLIFLSSSLDCLQIVEEKPLETSTHDAQASRLDFIVEHRSYVRTALYHSLANQAHLAVSVTSSSHLNVSSDRVVIEEAQIDTVCIVLDCFVHESTEHRAGLQRILVEKRIGERAYKSHLLPSLPSHRGRVVYDEHSIIITEELERILAVSPCTPSGLRCFTT